MARSCVPPRVMTLLLVAVMTLVAASTTSRQTEQAGSMTDAGCLPSDVGARFSGCLADSGLHNLLFPTPDRIAITTDIRQRLDGLEQAYNDSDWSTFVSHATNDCYVLIPGHDVIRGREAWMASGVFNFMKSIGGVSLSVFIDDVMLSGNDVAIVLGHDRLCAMDGTHVYQGKYVHVWKKIGDFWYMHYLIFNPSKQQRP